MFTLKNKFCQKKDEFLHLVYSFFLFLTSLLAVSHFNKYKRNNVTGT